MAKLTADGHGATGAPVEREPDACPCGGRFVREDNSFDGHLYGRPNTFRQYDWLCEDCDVNAADVLSDDDYRLLAELPEPEYEPE